MNNVWAMDIETVRDLRQAWVLPEPTIPGNYKKQETIDQYRAEAREKQLAQMALSPLTGRVFCVVFVNSQSEVISFCCKDETMCDEATVLRRSLQFLRQRQLNGELIVTYNGTTFDFPYLFKRCAICNVRQSQTDATITLDQFTERYENPYHLDLYRVWCGANGKSGSESLDTLIRAVLGVDRAMTVDTKQTHELIQTSAGRSALLGKCQEDATYTKQLYERFYGILF